MKDDGATLHTWLRDLFPISRSIVGPGIESSLLYLQNQIDVDSNILEYPSGCTVNGWTVPNAWELKIATITDLMGNIIVSTDVSNLHVWSHSIPFKGRVSRVELETHLLTSESVPEAIPYATTYYKPNWGFSVNYETYKSLNNDFYDVFIDTLLYPGNLKILEVLIPGELSREILFSTYLCHPSMANNELSGPVLATSLIRHLSQKENRYSYRFLIGPETIGPICYLSDHGKALQTNVIAAFNLTCVGAGDEWSLLHSPSGNTLADRIALNLLEHSGENFKIYDFLDRGSDERQYCSPNIDLPMVSIMRSKYGQFREYHNSLDDCNFVTPKRLGESLEFYIDLLTALEAEGILSSELYGEPFLTSYFNYPTVGGLTNSSKQAEYWLANQLVSFADGRSLVEVADRVGVSILQLEPILNKALSFGLISREPH